MNNIQIFENEQFGKIRSIFKTGQPWFIGKDVAEVLGYKDAADALKRHVDDDDKGVGETPTPGGVQNMIIINESGLYSLVLSSKLPSAKKFKRWITNEVLPQIRQTGGYIPASIEDDDSTIMARAFIIAQRTISKKDELLKEKEAELETKDKFIKQIAVSKNSLLVEEVAAIACKNGINIGRNRLWKKLRQWNIIKEKSKYDPKQKYIDAGYFEVSEGAKETYKGTFTYKTTRVTGKGQIFIINKLLEEKENL